MTDRDYTDIIAKLLRKAERTDSAAEAEAINDHVAQLMVKFEISMAEVEAATAERGGQEKPEEIREDSVYFYTVSYGQQLLNITYQVVLALGLNGYRFHTRGKGRYEYGLRIVGYESEIKAAKLLCESIQLQAVTAMREFWKEHPMRGQWLDKRIKEEKRGFLLAFGEGVATRIKLIRKVTIEDAGENAKALVLARDSRLNEYMKSLNTKKTRSTRDIYASDHAVAEGFKAGQRANVGGTSVPATGGKAALVGGGR